jgi:septal ring factor EnvC (AmiA/AmiB activator)
MRPPLPGPLLLLVAALLAAAPVAARGASTQDELKKRQAELQNLRSQIQAFEERIRDQQKRELSTLELLDTYDRKATLVRRLITRLKAEEAGIQRKIAASRGDLKRQEDQLAFLKAHYARYVASVYKRGRTRELEVLLTSNSMSQLFVRTEYLRRFSEQRRTDAERIGRKKAEIEDRQARLQLQLADERRLIAEKGAEEDRLAALSSDRADVLNQIRKDKRTTQRELDRKMKAAREIENLIAGLIEADRLRREKEAEEVRKGALPQPPATVGTFAQRKGKLRWPVSEGAVVARFGNQVHPTLRTVTQNTGIDISVPPGSPVTAVAEGEVSTITWLPSYGNLVIVNHFGGFRTVSTHLSEIAVTEGQRVKEGDLLGSSGESLDGPRLHFEVWKDREKQNPESWLSPQ